MGDARGERRKHIRRSQPRSPVAFSAFHRVPNEIIREIFSCIPSFGVCALEILINASQVCRLWRALALDMKGIWTDITLSSTDGNSTCQVELALERSIPRPITLRITDLSSRKAGYRKLVLRAIHELSRMGGLHIDHMGNWDSVDLWLVEDIAQVLRTYQAPLLEELRLFYGNASELLKDGNLFAGHIPTKLRVLEVATHVLHPIILRAPLTRLRLRNIQDDGLLDILRALPSLEHLDIFTEYMVNDDVPFSCPSVDLPKLRDVTFGGYFTTVTRFMRFLDFPTNADIHLEFYCRRSNPHSSFNELSWTCDGRLASVIASGLYFQNLSIVSPDLRHEVVDYAVTVLNPVYPSRGGPHLPREISLSFLHGDQFSDQVGLVTPRLLSFLPAVRSLRTLTVNSGNLRFLAEWESLSERLHGVVSITVSGVAAQGLAMGLCQGGRFFPHLTTLSIENVKFAYLVDKRPLTSRDRYFTPSDDESEEEPTSDTPLEERTSLIEVLLNGLRARDVAGLPIGRVSVRQSNVTVTMVAQLRAVLGADCVEWDGREDAGPKPLAWEKLWSWKR
ncbi:hypothetical protein BV25DRAFT_1829640 [Artomyces pyxidatus]|uniref:Uncharacterized protein n=1 Tax=Artomyces pyxidatus TaxID=48021 RepID=A0ACB8SRA1_9AGAM|nr:hypothetical protein BV25DRAFT_1829640 [Artomyces pyxidatus]